MIGASQAPMDHKPLQLNCPNCGHPLAVQQNPTGTVFRCPGHGLFWFDDDGNLREERRSPTRPIRPTGRFQQRPTPGKPAKP